MKNYYAVLGLLAVLPAAAQTSSAPLVVPADTLRPPVLGELPDSLARLGTFRLQGQEQPVRPFLTIQDQLRTVAGVQVTPYDGTPGSGNVVRIRGASVTLGQAQPLYIIDGLPALNDELTPDQLLGPSTAQTPSMRGDYLSVAELHSEVGGNPLLLLPPESIERVDVLAGPAAVARFGPLGANGVVSIRTRRGRTGRPLRVSYSAYAGIQQVRQRYSLLDASEFAAVANEAARRSAGPGATLPYPSTDLGTGTDWQAETYQTSGLQQHQVSLEGSSAKSTFLLGADYRQQSGVLRTADLTRYGLRLAVGHQATSRLALHGWLTAGQTDQHQPFATGSGSATREALLARPTLAVRTSQGGYSGYTGSSAGLIFANPVAVLAYTYRTPRTRRLLAQVAADYQLGAHLTMQATANFQRTLLDADAYAPLVNGALVAPESSLLYANQTYQSSQWASSLALRYQRQIGQRQQLGAELNYQYQGQNMTTGYEVSYQGLLNRATTPSYAYGYVTASQSAKSQLYRPWAHLRYALDSLLEVEAGLSYAHFKDATETVFYPNAQVSWHPQLSSRQLAPTLWLGAARTSTFGFGFGTFGPQRITTSSPGSLITTGHVQSPLYTDQVEAGLRLGRPTSHFSGQLVVYQRRTSNALIATQQPLPSSAGAFIPSLMKATFATKVWS
ncbi:TonB-dependent receptor plug domain-containing protein [Hymenobacter sp. BRD67]|uniref:TonB-dependent receptor plug domain-containing protein n=1 Tax=Hymenobacter sp. BRD67 TaxID=2675877 RepID=UPI001565E08A|nr:TonB-dependent receptor plug domain-containing protein [Hymenobacter sp. BRD67]QKG54166.1 TonB-dependent receptor plug domain-containing protein [Hymenobacter sp. BRD67]